MAAPVRNILGYPLVYECATRAKNFAKTGAAELVAVVITDQFNKGHNLLLFILL
jgi:hypothetical protein